MSESYTKVASHIVLNAYSNFEKIRAQEIEIAKDAAFETLSKRRFFKPKSRDQAVERMENCVSFYGWDTWVHGKCAMSELRSLALLPNDGFVRISASDARLVRNYFETVEMADGELS